MDKRSIILGVLCSVALPLAAHAVSGGKRVVVDKGSQTLRAYQNGQLVMQSRVSTGRSGRETPNGTFRAGSKQLMHRSTLYHNAPMPYSVNYSGNYFIHGFSSVPDYPASHGCIRMPLDAAPEFYKWVSPGTPITVTGKWAGNTNKAGKPKARSKPHSFFGRNTNSAITQR